MAEHNNTSGNSPQAKVKQAEYRLDRLQRRHPQLALPVAVYRKYSDDQAGNLANLMAYWAFFSLFPLLLVAITIMGFVGVGQGTFRAVLKSFPLVGPSVSSQKGLTGNPWALTLGIVVAVWTGLAVFKATQTAFDTVWEIPLHQRPGFADRMIRSVKALVVLGIGFIVTLGLSGIATGGKGIAVSLPLGIRLLIGALAVVLDIAGFCLAYVFLTQRPLTLRQVFPGAIFAGVLFFFLQLAGTALVSHGAKGHTGATGAIALVLGMLWWFSLQAQVALWGAEINVVVAQRRWPRGMTPDVEAESRPAGYRGSSRAPTSR
jgi:YihY family inner membrane protein